MKKLIMMSVLLVSSSVFVVSAWSGSSSVHSLRGDVPLEASSVEPASKEWLDGEGKVNRQYVQQPPLVPHTIDDFNINRKGNDCLSCHNWNSEMPGATKVGVSHFVNRKGDALSKISPNRYFCTQCHVPQKDVKPLIMNDFKSLSEE